jgi:chromosomal replication initiator protein
VRDHYLSKICACVAAETGAELRVKLEVASGEEVAPTRLGERALRDATDDGPHETSETNAEANADDDAEPIAPRDARLMSFGQEVLTSRQCDAGSSAQEAATPSLPAAAAGPRRAAQPAARAAAKLPPHAQHTFDSFVVGDCNALAREASLAVVRDSGPGLSQLFISSGPGLGKTHLSRAVCAEARASGRRAVYASAEAFTNEFLASLRSHQMERFKRKYRRDCDVLVVEDVHFLEGKESTQLEFFHSVQHVLDAGGRVVLTGHKLPQQLTSLEPRVRSQIAGGFVAELGPPDAQVRRNILRAKASAGGVGLPDDCLELLVDQVRGSVRELESVLIQLVTTASLLKRPIDLALTREALAKKGGLRVEAAAGRIQPAAVIAVVAAFFKTTQDVMASKSRRRDVLMPRQLAMYLCHEYTDASLVEIGRALGRDHPAVRNAITKIERKLLENAPLRYQVEALIERLHERIEAPRT